MHRFKTDMNKYIKTISLALVAFFIGIQPLAGCHYYNHEDNGLSGVIDITGSNTVTPLSSLFAEEFMSLHPRVNISVSGPGSGAGIASIINGTTDICQSSRSIRQAELDMENDRSIDIFETKIASDVIALIVHPSNPVSSLTIEQLSGIYTGEITNWKDLGGHDAAIVPLARDTNSGTHVYFKESVVQMKGLPSHDTTLEYGGRVQFLPSTSMGVTQVSQNTNAIFYVGLGYLDDNTKALGVKKSAGDTPVTPSLKTAIEGTYQIARGLYYYTDGQPQGLTREFIDFALSPQGQTLVEDAGFVPVETH